MDIFSVIGQRLFLVLPLYKLVLHYTRTFCKVNDYDDDNDDDKRDLGTTMYQISAINRPKSICFNQVADKLIIHGGGGPLNLPLPFTPLFPIYSLLLQSICAQTHLVLISLAAVNVGEHSIKC